MIYNQAAEGTDMPTYDKGDYAIPIEHIINMSDDHFLKLISSILGLNDCDCTMVDYPSIVSARVGRYVIDIVLGQGSIVCKQGCKEIAQIGIPVITLASSSWVYGRIIKRRKCFVTEKSLELISKISPILRDNINWVTTSFNDLIERVAKEKVKAFSFILPEYDPLSFVQTKCCGQLYSPNPLLHPGAVFGKSRKEVCVKTCTKILGPFRKKITPVLSIGEDPIISLYQGMGELLLASVAPNDIPNDIAKSLILSLIYTCSEGD